MLLLPSIDLYFLPKVGLPECKFLPKFAPESVSHGLYDLFLLSKWILTCISASTAETHIFVHPPHQDGSPQVNYPSLSALRLRENDS